MQISTDSPILIAEDVEPDRMHLRKILRDLSFVKIDEAKTGQEAITRLVSLRDAPQPYELLFLDWNMPVKSGLEVLQFCRSDERFKRLQIIMVTAETDRHFIVDALSSGVNDYIVKPVNSSELEKKLEFLNKRLAMK